MSGRQLPLMSMFRYCSDKLDDREMVEIGLGAPVDLDVLDRYIGAYRILAHLRRGSPSELYEGTRELYDTHLSSCISYEEFESMSTARGALMLFRSMYV